METMLLARTVPSFSQRNVVTKFVATANPAIIRFHHSSLSPAASRHFVGSHSSTIRIRESKVSDLMNMTNAKVTRRDQSVICYAGHGAILSTYNLQLIAAVSSLVLMLSRATAVKKAFLVPLFALLAPASVISWIKGDYGMWTAFLGLLVRLLFFIPGELDLLLMTMLLIIVAPYKVIGFRGTQAGAIIALVIASYLAFQHFSWAGNLKRAFEQGPLIASLAVIFVTITSILLLL